MSARHLGTASKKRRCVALLSSVLDMSYLAPAFRQVMPDVDLRFGTDLGALADVDAAEAAAALVPTGGKAAWGVAVAAGAAAGAVGAGVVGATGVTGAFSTTTEGPPGAGAAAGVSAAEFVSPSRAVQRDTEAPTLSNTD